MKTHVIIPIDKLKKIIKRKKIEMETSAAGGDHTRAAIESYELKLMENFLKKSKKIKYVTRKNCK